MTPCLGNPAARFLVLPRSTPTESVSVPMPTVSGPIHRSSFRRASSLRMSAVLILALMPPKAVLTMKPPHRGAEVPHADGLPCCLPYASSMTCCGVTKASKWWYAVGEDGRRRWSHSWKAAGSTKGRDVHERARKADPHGTWHAWKYEVSNVLDWKGHPPGAVANNASSSAAR